MHHQKDALGKQRSAAGAAILGFLIGALLFFLPVILGAQDTTAIKGYATRAKGDIDSVVVGNAKSRLNAQTIAANTAYLARARARQDSIITAMRGAAPTPPPAGIAVNPGSSIQTAVTANPAGSTFIIKAGTHVKQSVVPKAGDIFLGEPGAIMDGHDTTAMAFYAYDGATWVPNVTIRNIEITKYKPAAQRGAITVSADDTLNAATGWVLDSLYVHHNTNMGIRVGHRMQILRSRTQYNTTLGIGGVGRAILVDGLVSTFNNNGCPNNPGFESGGSKFVYTDSLVVRNSVFSDNCGVGLWLDIWNKNSQLYSNTVERNYREGICIEVSGPGHVIRNNVIRANGWPVDPFRANGWGWDAGIGIHETPEVEVHSNLLDENFNGIIVVQQPRDVAHGDSYAPVGGFIARDNLIHDNVIYQRTRAPGGDGGFAGGAVQDFTSSPSVFGRNNQWTNNTYYTASSSSTGNTTPFAWANGARTPAAWRIYNQDFTGIFRE